MTKTQKIDFLLAKIGERAKIINYLLGKNMADSLKVEKLEKG